MIFKALRLAVVKVFLYFKKLTTMTLKEKFTKFITNISNIMELDLEITELKKNLENVNGQEIHIEVAEVLLAKKNVIIKKLGDKETLTKDCQELEQKIISDLQIINAGSVRIGVGTSIFRIETVQNSITTHFGNVSGKLNLKYTKV